MMSEQFLFDDAVASLEQFKTTYEHLGISRCYALQTLNQLGAFLRSYLPAINEAQATFIQNYLCLPVGPMPKVPYSYQIETAEFFLPDDAYIRLNVALGCIVDYLSSIDGSYSETFSKNIVRAAKETFLLPMQKENKGLSLVYRARM